MWYFGRSVRYDICIDSGGFQKKTGGIVYERTLTK